MDGRRRPGEEITAAEYERAANDPGSVELSRCGAQTALTNYNVPIWDGCMVPKEGSKLFIAYGWNNYEKEKKYFYLGEVLYDPKLDGTFYYFDCLNAFVNEGYFPAKDFTDEEEAITTGANYKADIYKIVFDNGQIVKRTLLYTPYEGRVKLTEI